MGVKSKFGYIMSKFEGKLYFENCIEFTLYCKKDNEPPVNFLNSLPCQSNGEYLTGKLCSFYYELNNFKLKRWRVLQSEFVAAPLNYFNHSCIYQNARQLHAIVYNPMHFMYGYIVKTIFLTLIYY